MSDGVFMKRRILLGGVFRFQGNGELLGNTIPEFNGLKAKKGWTLISSAFSYTVVFLNY